MYGLQLNIYFYNQLTFNPKINCLNVAKTVVQGRNQRLVKH